MPYRCRRCVSLTSTFLLKTRVFDSEFLHEFKYGIGFVLRFVEFPSIGSQKTDLLFSLYFAMKTLKMDVLKWCVFIFRTQFLTYYAFLISPNFGFYNRFSKEPFFNLCTYRGKRCNDDALSIMLHNSAVWCHMMAILASFVSQRNRLSTNALFLCFVWIYRSKSK